MWKCRLENGVQIFCLGVNVNKKAPIIEIYTF